MNSTTPKLSIVTVNLNNAFFLKQAFKSIVDQSFSNYELIIIDGQSSDDSVDFLKSIQCKNINYISEPDHGIYDAMNKGIKLTKGEWIYFLGADDTIYPNAFNEIFSNNIEDFDLVYGNVRRMPSNIIYDGGFDLKKIFYKNICHQAIFYKRQLFDELGLFKIAYKSRADYAFNIQVFSRGFKTKYLPITVAAFNDNGFSSSYLDSNFWDDYMINYIRPFEKVIDQRERYGILWKYYYPLLHQKKVFKALKLILVISLHEYKLKKTFQGLKHLIISLITNKI